MSCSLSELETLCFVLVCLLLVVKVSYGGYGWLLELGLVTLVRGGYWLFYFGRFGYCGYGWLELGLVSLFRGRYCGRSISEGLVTVAILFRKVWLLWLRLVPEVRVCYSH